MAEQLGAVLREPKSSTCEDLAAVCRFCATDEGSSAIIDSHENIDSAITSLLEVALEGRADNDEKPIDHRRSRLAICTLINTCNRSEKLRATVKPEIVNLCRALLRVDEMRMEFTHFLMSVIKKLNEVCALDKDYPQLLAEVAMVWETMEDNTAVTALFVTLLETDYAFLAHSFADFPLEAFTALMRITEVILDSSETDAFFNVHSNNVIFCVNLIERIVFDFGEDGHEEKRADYMEQLVYATECIGSCALRHEDYGDVLLAKSEAVHLVVDVLDTLLDAQAVLEAAEGAGSTRPKYDDRPERPISSRIPRVQENKGMAELSDYLVLNGKFRGQLKEAAVRTIGNLCCNSRVNQLAAGERGGVISVLKCTRKHQDDKPFIMQWAIAAVRHMVITCPENQDILVSIDQKPSGIIDREKLFKELGVEVVMDELTGKFKVLRVEK